jgi:hypothetical protein
MNLLLDLDETIISSVRNKEVDTECSVYKMDGWHVYSRPRLEEFLDYIFSNFNVSIFTASGQEYCMDIIDNLILKDHPERRLDFIFHSKHCDVSDSLYPKNAKSLKMLWNEFGIAHMNITNTILLDDRVDLKKIQPDCMVINLHPFNVEKDGDKDNELLSVIEKLKTLRNAYYLNQYSTLE